MKIKKIFKCLLLLSVITAPSISIAAKVDATTDTASITFITNYLKELYSPENAHSLLIKEFDVILLEKLFYNKIKDNATLAAKCTVASPCNIADFNLTATDVKDSFSAYYNYEKDKGLTSLSYSAWKTEKHYPSDALFLSALGNFIKKITYTKTGNTETIVLFNEYGTGNIALKVKMTVVVTDNEVSSLEMFVDTKDLGIGFNTKLTFNASNNTYEVNLYICNFVAESARTSNSCINKDIRNISDTDFNPITNVKFDVARDTGNVSNYSGRIFFYRLPDGAGFNGDLSSYWQEHSTLFRSLSATTMTKGDYIELGSGSGQLPISW